MTHSKDQAVLTVMSIDNVIETDFDKVYPDMTLGELVQVVGRAKRNLFPVVERETDKLLGVVSLDDIRNIMFRPELYDRYKVDRIMVSPPARIQSDMHMDHIMHLFDETKAWNLPVVTPEEMVIRDSYSTLLLHALCNTPFSFLSYPCLLYTS